VSTPVLEVEGPAAPPRDNGELVFAEPWESRAFGLAVTLHDAGAFTWDDFRDHLVARIADWERSHPEGECFRYYACWLRALESVVADRGLVAPDELTARATALAERPAGHDHADGEDHGHGHGHGH
jgi:nitrile hydratase accessory protein